MACEVHGFEQAVAELRSWMQEKATLMARDTNDHSLLSGQTLQKQHKCLEVSAHTPWASCVSPTLKAVCRGTPERPGLSQPRDCLPGLGSRAEVAWESLGSRAGLLRGDLMLPDE